MQVKSRICVVKLGTRSPKYMSYQNGGSCVLVPVEVSLHFR